MIEPILLTEKGEPVSLEGPVTLEEARTYVLRVPNGGEARAWLGALPLQPSTPGTFELTLDHVVGGNVLQVRLGEQERAWPIRIQPRPDKLPDELWLTMVSEIEAWAPGASVGTSGARHGAVGREGVSLSVLVESLTPLIPSLERAVRALLRHPRERTRSQLEEVPLHRARQVGREALTWLGRHPDVARWLEPWEAVELAGAPPPVPQRIDRDTADHPANRYVSWLLVRVLAQLRAAVEGLRRLAGRRSGQDEASRWCLARAVRLEAGARRLEALWRRSFLRELPREPASEAALLVVLDDPAYARVHRIGQRFLSPRFRLDGAQDPGAAVVPSFTMYELWCFLAVGRQLRAVLPEGEGWGWTWRGLGRLLGEGTGSGAGLVGAHLEHGRVELLFNPKFRGYLARGDAARWSLSGERRPDLVVTWVPGGREGTWLALDAKYRAGRSNLAEAFESVHIYRDALRFDGHGGTCRAACLLAPACDADVAPWFSEDFRSEHRCGIWELRPGATGEPHLARWIVDLLGVPGLARPSGFGP